MNNRPNRPKRVHPALSASKVGQRMAKHKIGKHLATQVIKPRDKQTPLKNALLISHQLSSAPVRCREGVQGTGVRCHHGVTKNDTKYKICIQ